MIQAKCLSICVFLLMGKGVKQLSGEELNLKNGMKGEVRCVEIRRMPEVSMPIWRAFLRS
jgi:hypothetical protein